MTKKKDTTKDKARQEGLAEWRLNNQASILELLNKKLKSIIEDGDSDNRDINEAARTLARMAGILAPEKVSAPPTKNGKADAWLDEELSAEESEELDRIIGSGS